MSLFFRIIDPSDIEEIRSFEKSKNSENFQNEMEGEIFSWTAPWREESLKHYLSLGWSFLARDPSVSSSYSSEGKLVGYFIAQPLLFFEGNTQSLWVEHVQFDRMQVRDELCELAYKLSREKHFQKVFFPDAQTISNAFKTFKVNPWSPKAFFANTTRTNS